MRESTVIGCVFLAVGLVAMGICGAINHIRFYGEQSEIERLRIDVQSVPSNSDEGVFGLAAEANMSIALWRRYNNMWWSGYMVHNGWDHVNFIELEKTDEN